MLRGETGSSCRFGDKIRAIHFHYQNPSWCKIAKIPTTIHPQHPVNHVCPVALTPFQKHDIITVYQKGFNIYRGKKQPFVIKGSLKNNFTEFAPRFGSDLDISIEQNHPAKGGTISRILSRPGREGLDKDGLKMGCENGKLFLAEPLIRFSISDRLLTLDFP